MGPIVKELKTANADKSVKFITFDFTTDEAKKTAAATAAKFGVSALYNENQSTGFAILYDTKTKKVITKLSASDDTAKWQQEIDKGLKG